MEEPKAENRLGRDPVRVLVLQESLDVPFKSCKLLVISVEHATCRGSNNGCPVVCHEKRAAISLDSRDLETRTGDNIIMRVPLQRPQATYIAKS